MQQVRIEVYSHAIKVIPRNKLVSQLCLQFCVPLIKYTTTRVVEEGQPAWKGKLVEVPDCTYAVSPHDRSFFAFHIEQKDEFFNFLYRGGLKEYDIELVEIPLYKPAKANLVVRPKWSTRDYQKPVIDFMVEPGVRKIIPVQTGKGKGYMSMAAAAEIGERLIVVTKGGYIDKWLAELKEVYKIRDDRILIIRGSKALMRALELARAGELDVDIILLSTDTLSQYIRGYEASLNTELQDLYMDPRLMYYVLRCGVRIIDEAHQMLHAYYKIDLYTHIPKAIYLSATIIGNDTLETKIHEIIYPKKHQFTSLEWDKYIDVIALYYNLRDPQKARYKDFRKNYSHVMFEQYLMRNKKLLRGYLALIYNQLVINYIKPYKPKTKFMIFASTIEMCNVIVEHLRPLLAKDKLTVCRYVGEDDLDSCYEYDVWVTTPGSGGTAIDVPNLVGALSTCAISSNKLNIQMLGRLRRIKDYPEMSPVYLYLVCADIDKHVRYDNDKYELFADLVKSHRKESTYTTV